MNVCLCVERLSVCMNVCLCETAAETIPLSPILVYSNVIYHLALRGTLRFFESNHERLTEGFVTDEVSNYVETMANIARTMRNKKSSTGTVFMPPPGYVYLPRPVHQILYLVIEAAYARELHFYIEAPNYRDEMAPV